MKFFKQLTELFSTENKELDIAIEKYHNSITYAETLGDECKSCMFKGLCKAPQFLTNNSPCFKEDYSYTQDTILIIDDNESITQFLREDIEYLDSKGVCDLKTTNLLPVTGSHAAFNLYSLQQKNEGLDITHAIIDLSYSGSVNMGDKVTKFTGVDVYKSIIKYNPHVKVLFYSNKLNPKIKIQAKMIADFKELTGKYIGDFMLNKTSLNIRQRRAQISQRLFGKDLERV